MLLLIGLLVGILAWGGRHYVGLFEAHCAMPAHPVSVTRMAHLEERFREMKVENQRAHEKIIKKLEKIENRK